MSRLLKTVLVLGVCGFVAAAVGFAVFTNAVVNLRPDETASADAIVVLTGDDDRISTGMRLMEEGRGHRMLISGVHPSTRMPKELKAHLKENEALVRCCVDIGREAINTSGNAEEARQWMRGRGIKSLIIVTSSYHLPRSLVEFRRVMPAIKLTGYAVQSTRNAHASWWQHRSTARLLASEYVKYLGSAVRLAFARFLTEGQSDPARPAPPALPIDGARTARTVR